MVRSLPSQLRSRTSCMINESKLRTCPLFEKGDRKFIAALATALLPEVYLPAEFIVVAGFVSRAMYFIARGRVQIIRRDRGGTNSMKVEETYFEGAEAYGDGFQSLFTGGNYGKVVVTTRRAKM